MASEDVPEAATTATGGPSMTADDLKARYGNRALVIEDPEFGLFAFRAPSKEEWSKYFDRAAADDKRDDKVAAMESLVFACRVYPEDAPGHQALKRMLDELAAKGQSIFGELIDLIGAGDSGHVELEGAIAVVDKPETGRLEFKRPSKAAWARFLNMLARDDRRLSKYQVFVDLARDCFVGTREKFAELLEAYPGIPQGIQADLQHLAGGGSSQLGKR
jgi:hypothetical protein